MDRCCVISRTFPCGGELDQDTILGVLDTCKLVVLNEFQRLGNRCLSVVRETSVDLCGNTAWNQLQDFNAKVNTLFDGVMLRYECGITRLTRSMRLTREVDAVE